MRAIAVLIGCGCAALAAGACDQHVNLGEIGDGGASLLWRATFESGDLSEWTSDGNGGTRTENAPAMPAVTQAVRLRDPAARAEFAAKGGGHLFVEPIRAFRAVSGGLQISLLESYRLDMRPLDLTVAMHMLLQGRHSLAGSWMAGQQPFEPALLAPTTTSVKRH
jgi:hypothetical protein